MYRFTLDNPRLGKLELKTPPVGWNDMTFEYTRDRKYHGISANITFDAEFVKEGMDFINRVYQREGIESQVNIQVEKYNTETFEYQVVYNGKLSFLNYRQEEIKVVCNIEQAGYARKFLNSDDVEVNLQKLHTLNGQPITPFQRELEVLQLHSKEIIKKYEAKVSTENIVSSMPITGHTDDKTFDKQIVYFGFDQVDSNELNITSFMTGFDPEVATILPLIQARESGPGKLEVRLKGWIKAIRELNISDDDFDIAEFKVYWKINNSAGVELRAQQLIYHYSNNVTGDFYREFDAINTIHFNLNPGDQVYLYGEMLIDRFSGNLLSSLFNNFDFQHELFLSKESYLKITGNTQTEPSKARGLMAHEAFARIVQATSDMQAEFRSDFFGRTDSQPVSYAADGPGSLLWISNGFQIRNFPIAEKPIFSSFRNLFESMDAIYNLGVGIENIFGHEIVRVEPKEYFYKDEVILDLGCVANLAISLVSDYYHNQAEFGYNQWQTEQVNGLEEFNAKQTVTLPLTQVKSKYSALSPYIASGYMLEMTRRDQYVSTETKDNRQDNSNFLVCVLRNGNIFQTERNQNLIFSENVFSPTTLYNLRISPARNKRRHVNYLKASLLKQLNKKIEFNSAEGNYKMRSQLAGEDLPLAENEDLLVDDIPDPSFIPEHYEFSSPLSDAQREQIEANPYGQIEFEGSDGIKRRGYLVKLKYKADGRGEFTLLRAYNG